MTLLLAAAGSVAQTPTTPPGFAAHCRFTATSSVPFVRGVLALPSGRHLVAIRGDLWLADATLPNPGASAPSLQFAGEDIAFLAPAPGGSALVGGLRTGRIVHVQPTTGTVLGAFRGPANAFDAEALPGGLVLLNANPGWPAAGAHAGVWLAGPGRVPRLLLQLVGPSGPLVSLPNGDLVVAELGVVVPPPPGAARLLRFPAALVQQAVAGGTLLPSDAVATGTGFAGLYDLAADDLGHLYVSDPASSIVQRTDAGGLTPTGPWLDAGPGRFVTSLRFAPGIGAPFAAHQPTALAPTLFVTSSDYTARYEQLRVAPVRPQAWLAPSAAIAPGPSQLHVAGGPANGAGLWLASLTGPVPEQALAWIGGTPLWLGLPAIDTVPLAALPLDAQGAASLPFVHVGGVASPIHFQALTLAPISGSVATSAVLLAQLLP